MAEELLRVITSTPDLDSARRLARAAVTAGLAGNAQIIGPVHAVFRHLGEVGEGSEHQLTLSTTRAAYAELERRIAAEHPWQNPEIIAIPLAAAPEGYARWLAEATARPQSRPRPAG